MTFPTIVHFPGRHCASTALRDLSVHHGLHLTEPMCFGIGAGLGIWYLKNVDPSVPRLIHVRSADIEYQFFTRIGRSFSWERFDDPAAAQRALCQRLDEGRPALIQTDIFFLPYYNSSTHFPGHAIMVWAYDSEREMFQVTDTEREGVIDVPFDSMAKARFARGGFFDVAGNMFAPRRLEPPADLAAVICRAITDNSRVLLDDSMEYQGVRALREWKSEILDWGDFEKWQWNARFAYQVIERRGTGGGGFRLMYADFLRQAAAYLPEVSRMGLPDKMNSLGEAWRHLALALKEVSEQSSPDFRNAAAALQQVMDLAEAYHHQAAGLAS